MGDKWALTQTEAGEWPHIPTLSLCLQFGCEEMWGCVGGGAVGIHKKTVSPKFHAFAAVSEATRSPVVFKPKASVFIKNENKFFSFKKGELG